jgi:hypothetical protein
LPSLVIHCLALFNPKPVLIDSHFPTRVARWYILIPKKSQFLNVLRSLGMEIFGIFHGHSVYFAATWYMLWPLGILCGRSVYYSPFGTFTKEYLATPSVCVWLIQEHEFSCHELDANEMGSARRRVHIPGNCTTPTN